MQKTVVVLLALILVLGLAGVQWAADSPVQPAKAPVRIQNTPLSEQFVQSGIPIIDIRREDEWRETGVVPGSHLITFFSEDGSYDIDAFLSRVGQIVEPDESVAILCRSGRRSYQVANFLTRKGYVSVVNVYEGVKQGIASGVVLEAYDESSDVSPNALTEIN